VYISGSSSVSWDGPAGQPPLHAYSEERDIIVLKLDASGAFQLHTFYGSAEEGDYGASIAVGGSGVFITGGSGASWDGPAGQAPLHAYSGKNWIGDIIVLNLDFSGAYQWHTFYGSESDEWGNGIAADNSGVYIIGVSRGSWNGPSDQAPLHTYSGGDDDLVVLKLMSTSHMQYLPSVLR